MFCVSLQSLEPLPQAAEMVELRVDLAACSPESVRCWMAELSVPLLLTVGQLDPQPWADLQPDWLDIPWDREAPYLGKTRLIRSP